MIEKYEFPQEEWSYGLKGDMYGNAGRLGQKGLLTRMTSFPNSDENRPVGLRIRRAEFCKNVTELRESHRKGEINTERYQQEIRFLIDGLENDDEIYFNFLERIRPISVDMGELGVQEANYVDLTFRDTDLTKPPIIFIPGISNDVNGSGEFPLELALSSKRRVIMFTYPESPQGRVTNKFAKAVLKSNHFKPHVDFFKKAINQVIGENINFDFCGVSTGSIIASEISKDNNFTHRIGKINLIVPPGLTGLNLFEIKKRLKLKNEEDKNLKEGDLTGKLMVINPKNLDRDKEDIKNSDLTYKFLVFKLLQKYKWWKGMSEARVIISKDDGTTYGIKNIKRLLDNPNLSIEIVNGGHQDSAINPSKTIEKMVL